MTQFRLDLADFDLEVRDGEPVLVVAGELDLSNEDEFLDRLRELVEAAQSPAVVDLSGVSFVGASAMNALVHANRDANQRDVTLVLAAPSPHVRQVLDVTDLSSVLEIRDCNGASSSTACSPATDVTPEEVRSRAMHCVKTLGAPPDTARDRARWRALRDTAAYELAAAVDSDVVLLSRAMLLSHTDELARELLIEARGYCPRGRGERR